VLKENIAVAHDRASRLVDVILDSIVMVDHQFANSPSHSWAAWACFFPADAWLALDAVFFCMRRRETIWRYEWVDFRSCVCIFMDTNTLLLY